MFIQDSITVADILEVVASERKSGDCNKATKLLRMAMQELELSARSYGKILKIARTIANLNEQSTIQPDHVAEAIQYRSLDRRLWA